MPLSFIFPIPSHPTRPALPFINPYARTVLLYVCLYTFSLVGGTACQGVHAWLYYHFVFEHAVYSFWFLLTFLLHDSCHCRTKIHPMKQLGALHTLIYLVYKDWLLHFWVMIWCTVFRVSVLSFNCICISWTLFPHNIIHFWVIFVKHFKVARPCPPVCPTLCNTPVTFGILYVAMWHHRLRSYIHFQEVS